MNTMCMNTLALRIGLLAPMFAMVLPHLTLAIPASPQPFTVRQPDGTAITLHVRGDEYFNWWEDLEGYTVVRDGDRYLYAQRDAKGELVATGWLVGRVNPAAVGLARRILPSREVQSRIRAARVSPAAEDSAGRAIPRAAGTLKNVVILLQFANHAARELPTQADYDTIFNASGPTPPAAPTGSVRSVYLEDSYGQFEINSTVFGWYLLPETEQFYAHGTSGLGQPKIYILDALDLADADIDFSQFDEDNDGFVDGIAFIHSGYGAEFGGTDVDGAGEDDRIWSHRSSIPTWTSDEGVSVRPYHISSGLWGLSGSDPGRIGVICHESGHFFGIPDLYDTNNGGEGIGSWGMMANSWGFDGTQYFPPHFCAWSKIRLNWLIPTVLDTPGIYALTQVESIGAVYRVDAGYPPDEYLLIENRQPFGHESAIPQGGLAIFHIDDTSPYSDEGYPGQPGWPENGNHYRVALLQADGLYNLEQGHNRGDAGDAYHGGGGGVSAIHAGTVPNTDAYQGGNVYSTGHSIWGISSSGPVMTFNFDYNYNDPVLASPPHDSPKHRYLSIDPTTNPGVPTAIKVEIAEMRRCSGDPVRACLTDDHCQGGATGPCVNVAPTGPPLTYVVQEPQVNPSGAIPVPAIDDWFSRVVPLAAGAPYGTDWSVLPLGSAANPVLHIGDCEISPNITYNIYACDPVDINNCSNSLVLGTQTFPATTGHDYGDIAGETVGGLITGPDGSSNVADILAFLLTKKNYGTAVLLKAHRSRMDLYGIGDGIPPDMTLSVTDLSQVYVYGWTKKLPWQNSSGGLEPQNCP